MNYRKLYESWLNNPNLDEKVKKELEKMDEDTIKESFYDNLSFGTAGMRAIMGIGTNRLNIYTIRKATEGYANYLIKYIKNSKKDGVVIGHDNRLNSREFCLDCAALLTSKGIKVYIFDDLRPTPEISFAIRELKASGGIILTASHNPKEYNGYKVYDNRGCQLTDNKCNLLIEEINKIEDIISLKFEANKDLITVLDYSFDKLYYNEIKKLVINDVNKENFKIVYSPQHGTALKGVKEILSSEGYDLHLVEAQCTPDPYFSNTLSPNPEDERAFIEATKLAKQINAHLIITTDPDGDRIGISVKHKGEYILINGNQTGALLLDYILNNKKHDSSSLVITSIVTSSLIEDIARRHKVTFKQTLTGFKYIGEEITNHETTNNLILACEESYGYVLSSIVRDKDSLQASLMISEMTCFYLNTGKTLIDRLNEIYDDYGYHYDKVLHYSLDPLKGKEQIEKIMNILRKDHQTIFTYKLKRFEDYLEDHPHFYKSNVLRFVFEDNSFIALRPSGTEPKYKVYYSLNAMNEELAIIKFNKLQNELNKKIS